MTESAVVEEAEARSLPKRDASTTIKSVERAARLLSYFTVSNPRRSLNEITEHLGVSKATAHRYAVALRGVNLLRYDSATTTYTLGPQALTLGNAARAGLTIITLAGPVMEQLVRQVDETVVLSIWDGEAPTVVRTADNTLRAVRVSVAVGARLGAFDSAQGKVFCAFLPEREVPGLAAAVAASPDLADELEQIRHSRLAANTPEVHGLHTIASPVMGLTEIVAVMAIVGTAASLRPSNNSPAANRLLDAAQELSRLLGE